MVHRIELFALVGLVALVAAIPTTIGVSPRVVHLVALSFSFLALAFGWSSLALGAAHLEARHIGAFHCDFDLPATEERAIQQQGVLNALLISELNVGKTFWMTGELVNQDSDAHCDFDL